MSQPPQNAATLEPPGISPEEIHAELQAVLSSPAFERSEKLQKFLRFICDLTIRGEGSRINEYLIGSVVFLRGPEYSPSEDSIVRRQAHTLRQKLQEYYAGEGQSHAIRIELPVGRYVPNFRMIQPVAAPEEPAAAAEIAAPAVARPLARWPVFVLGALALLAAGYSIGAYRHPAEFPTDNEIWESWAQKGQPATICFSSPMTAVIKRFDQPLPQDTVPKRFRASSEEEDLFRRLFRTPGGGAFYFTPAVNQTKAGEAIAAVQLTGLLTRLQIPVHTTQSRFVSWEDLRGGNMILLGNNEANPWLDPLLTSAPFQLTPSQGKRQRAIVNTAPRAGEQAEFIINYGASEQEGDQEYALISMLPGSSPNQRLLLISGLNAQATQASAEYLTAKDSLHELIARLRQEAPRHHGPWNFQAVLRTEVHDKVPLRTELVALRVL